jgi:hypothetical protein
MDYIQVTRWKEMQQYKDRDPKWIKVYRELLDDYEFSKLDDVSKYHVIGLRLLAAKLDNKIPNDPDWIQKKLSSSHEVSIQALVDAGFIEEHDGTEDCTVQNCTNMYLETEGETEKSRDRKEAKKKKTPVHFPENLDNQPFRTAWSEWEQYRKDKRQTLTPRSVKMQLKLLSKTPAQAVAMLEQSIMNGYTGIFELKKGFGNESVSYTAPPFR